MSGLTVNPALAPLSQTENRTGYMCFLWRRPRRVCGLGKLVPGSVARESSGVGAVVGSRQWGN